MAPIDSNIDNELDALFRAQYSLINHAQARQLGLSAAAIRHRVECGDWVRVRTGVYAARGAPGSWRGDVMAAVLFGGSLVWASHGTAAQLWGFSGFSYSPIELTVLRNRRIRVDGVRAHRSDTLDDRDLSIVDGIPTISVARTIVDLSSRFDAASLGGLVDDGLRRRVLSIGALDRVTRRLYRIAPGRSPKTLARVLADRVPGYHPGGSDLEAWVFDLLVAAGLPAPVRQHRVVTGGKTYYLDLAYTNLMIAIEVDGFEFHSERTAFDADRSRQNDLVAAGWTILRFTSRSTPAEIVAKVKTLLGH